MALAIWAVGAGPGFDPAIGQPPLDELAKGEGKRSQMGPPGRIDESQDPNEEPQIALCTHNASAMERREPMSIKIIRSTSEYLATSAVA